MNPAWTVEQRSDCPDDKQCDCRDDAKRHRYSRQLTKIFSADDQSAENANTPTERKCQYDRGYNDYPRRHLRLLALDCCAKLAELNHDSAAFQQHPLAQRIGINSGDVIIADECGVVVMDRADAEAAAGRAIAMQEAEAKTKARLDAGEKLPDISGATKVLEDALAKQKS